MQTEYGTDIALPSQLELAETSELLDPAKDLFNPSAGMNRLGVALMAGGTAIDRGATGAAYVLGDMRRDAVSSDTEN